MGSYPVGPIIHGAETPQHGATWVDWTAVEKSVYLVHGTTLEIANDILAVQDDGTIVAKFKGKAHPDFPDNGKLVWFGLSTNNSYFNGRYGPIVIEVNPSALREQQFGYGGRLRARQYRVECSLPILARKGSPSIFGHKSIAFNWPSEPYYPERIFQPNLTFHPEVAVETEELVVNNVRVRLDDHGCDTDTLCLHSLYGVCDCKNKSSLEIHYEALIGLWKLGILPTQVGLPEGSDIERLIECFDIVANIDMQGHFMTWNEVTADDAFDDEARNTRFCLNDYKLSVGRLLQFVFVKKLPAGWKAMFDDWVDLCERQNSRAYLKRTIIVEVLTAFNEGDLQQVLDICEPYID